MKNGIREKLTGETGYFEKMCFKIYARKDHEKGMKIKEENERRYKFLTIIFLALLILKLVAELVPSEDNLLKKGELVQGINRPEKGVYGVTLVASVMGETETFEKEVPFAIRSLDVRDEKSDSKGNPEKDGFKQIQESKILDFTRKIDESGNRVIMLPVETEEGVHITWTEKTNNDLAYLFSLFLVCVLLVYMGRYKKMKILEKEARESVVKELPDFINLMLLLLSAGLIFSSAFEKYSNNLLKNGKDTYFASQMIEIRNQIDETNSPLIVELKNFAERTEIREFIRTVNIISDNVYKGSLLVEKLEVESNLLWENRRKGAEENNRIAETKLSFPLAIHLIVLIGVTIAPPLIST